MTLFYNLLALLTGFGIVIVTVPSVLQVANEKKLFDPVDGRKIHTKVISSLGGVAIFIGFILSVIVATQGLFFSTLKYIIAATVLMFFTGLKDDLVNISPRQKFTVQLIAVLLLFVFGNIQITNFHGLFGVYNINNSFSLLITMFIMLSIINAFNLIDGIDGLAAGLGILASSAFGTWFIIAGHIQYAIMAFALAGSLGGFFIFNVFGNKNKLFMGDSGSLIIGLIVSVLVIKFNELNAEKSLSYIIDSAPSVSFSVVLIPLVDTLRVMTIRISQKKSPFFPDKNHIHHRLLTLIPSHLIVTVVIVLANLVLIGVALLMNFMALNHTLQFVLIFLFGISFSFLPSTIIKINQYENYRSEGLISGTGNR